MKILITGGAGFVGAYLCRLYKSKYPNGKVVAFDNLHRRGSELNIQEFSRLGIDFVHGDIRIYEDLSVLEDHFDLFIEASAEPSVLMGLNKPNLYALQTNLQGTVNCLNFALHHADCFNFLSTSRVYSIDPLKKIPLKEGDTRFYIDESGGSLSGLSEKGINEDFPVNTARSIYGATKLASELLIQEYVDTYNLKAIINRCGVLCGAGQFGKVEQGVFTLWVARHYLEKPLKYTGFGGKGKQVRDLLHPKDLFEAIEIQRDQVNRCSGEIYNIGGGTDISVSLLELTKLCQEITGNSIEIQEIPETTAVDIPLYITDYGKAHQGFGWKPNLGVQDIVSDIYEWLTKNHRTLQQIF